jgi:drug/metabolite transporter (DMT)-like permease
MHYLLYFFAIFCLSQSAHWVKWSGAAVTMLGFWRLFSAGLIWALFFRVSDWKRALTQNSVKVWGWTSAAGILLFLHLWSFQYAAQHTRIANQMILFASNPLWTAGITVLFFKEKLTLRLVIAYLLSLGGIAILVAHQVRIENETLLGDSIALSSALLYSAYIVCSQQARRDLPNSVFSMVLFPLAAICFGIGCLIQGVDLKPPDQKAWIAIAGLTFMSTLFGHSLFAYLLKHMNINWMSCGKLLEPVLAAMTAYFLFNETIGSSSWWAFLLTAGGVLVLILGRHSKAEVTIEKTAGELQ